MCEVDDKYCGNCCWFYAEMTDGYGFCACNVLAFADRYCGHKACERYVSCQEMRHHMAVLLQANRYRRYQHVPSIYRMPDPTELGKAIDFSVKYMKTYCKL